ncbi:MAG: helix-turn-helix domain-containing protein [Tissierellales bacterium]|nr:helix-turn-helix domain-containing protein [Tissierellales bacterium]
MEKIMKIGEKIKAMRLNKQLKQIDLAKKAHISNTYLSDIELGRVNPSLQTLEKISTALEVDSKLLFDKKIDSETDIEQYMNYKKFMFFFNHIQEGIIVMDISGNILEVNAKFCEMTGFVKKNLIGNSLKKYICPMNYWKVRDLVYKNYHNKIIFEEELYKKEDKEVVCFRINLQKIKSSSEEYLIAFVEKQL